MSKTKKLEQLLADLACLRSDPTSEHAVVELRKAVLGKDNYVAARAAEMAGEFYLQQLEPVLVQAFHRFMVNPVKVDPGCSAKTAIAEALYRMEAYQADLYLTGISHRQLEPVWGGQEDTAAMLRGVCALGLVRMNYENVMIPLAHLLADQESDARIAAARAIGYSGLPEGIPLLRLKVLVGDRHPQVLCECFNALIKLAPEPSLAFVAGFMQQEDTAVVEAAALALGESQLSQAFPFLESAWEASFDRETRKTYLMAIALLRNEDALAYLEELIVHGPRAHAVDALEALSLYKEEPRIWSRVESALKRRDTPL
ncbi:MAG: HEAT repeat domain-containing protein [Anaerolineae bacterium]|nr:HEAT repeat domain-containing protein [Anaerolineae bacterium]